MLNKTSRKIHKSILIIGIAIISIYSCKKENEILHPCIGKIQELENVSNCGNREDDFYCKIKDIGNYKLLEESKDFAPQFCSELGTIFSYGNESGEVLDYELTRKVYYKSFSVRGADGILCENSSKGIGHCIDTETIAMTLTGLNRPSKFFIVIKVIMNVNSDGKEEVADLLTVWSNPDSTSNDANLGVRAIINERTLKTNYFDVQLRQEFFDSIEILDENYLAVYSMDISGNFRPSDKIYYNSEKGMIAFKEPTGEIWKLID